MLRATGTVVRVESKPWAMEGRTGISRTVRILVGDADFADLKYPELDRAGHPVPLPEKGEQVDLAVVVTSPGGRTTVTAQGAWSLIVGETAAAPSRPVRAAASA